MDAVLVGGLTALTAISGMLWWQLLVRPEVLLGPLTTEDAPDGWFVHHPGAVRALKLASGGLVFLFGLLTGLALTFLARTG